MVFNNSQVDKIEIFATVQLYVWTWAKFSGSRLQSSFARNGAWTQLIL